MSECGKKKTIPNGILSSLNTTTVPLNAGITYTGTGERFDTPDVMVSCKTDQDGKLFIDFSNDNFNWDIFPPTGIDVFAGIHEFHIAVKGPRWYRVRFTNTSASNQTYLRLYSYFGVFRQSNSPANSTIQSDADASLVRPLDFNSMVGEGLYQNRSNTIKDGYTPLLSSGVLSQDVWTEAGSYNGFPIDSGLATEVVSSNAGDVGTFSYSYLSSPTDKDYTFGSVTLNGTTPVLLPANVWRSNFSIYDTLNNTTFNLGKITMRRVADPTIIFNTIDIGRSQSYCSAYTVPYGSFVQVDRKNGAMRGSASGSLDGYFWYREYEKSPRLRFPFVLQYGSLYFDDVDYLVGIPERTDFMPRIVNASANNLIGQFEYRLLKIKR